MTRAFVCVVFATGLTAMAQSDPDPRSGFDAGGPFRQAEERGTESLLGGLERFKEVASVAGALERRVDLYCTAE